MGANVLTERQVRAIANVAIDGDPGGISEAALLNRLRRSFAFCVGRPPSQGEEAIAIDEFRRQILVSSPWMREVWAREEATDAR